LVVLACIRLVLMLSVLFDSSVGLLTMILSLYRLEFIFSVLFDSSVGLLTIILSLLSPQLCLFPLYTLTKLVSSSTGSSLCTLLFSVLVIITEGDVWGDSDMPKPVIPFLLSLYILKI